jgi:UDP-N-acetylmuramoylalanine--D-glutamate ligase
MEIAGRKILIIGLGMTGLATAKFLALRGASVVATDEKPSEELERLLGIHNLSAAVKIAGYDASCLSGIDLIVPSPGVPPFNSIIMEALKRKVSIMSEIELAYNFLRCPMIAITGTNGKTTTTTLIGNILKKAGKKVFVGGNIGEPLVGFTDGTQDADYAVVEVSSFQLQWIEHFCPSVAVLLNITCDHVNYHGSFTAYRYAKERIFENQTPFHLAVINADDPFSKSLANRIAARIGYFSSGSLLEKGIFKTEGKIVHIPDSGQREIYPLDMVKIPGRHNLENVMAAITAARECGASTRDVIAAVADFKGLPHRIEFAGEKKGVAFYNDSKGTNVDAVARALESFSQPVVLLMGGRDKDGDFETLTSLLGERVKELILFGEAKDRIDCAIGGIVKTSRLATLGEAIMAAYDRSSAGEIVLLSPGCASFDEFSDYKARGDFFKKTVGEL